jgi:predicted acetyltransferase
MTGTPLLEAREAGHTMAILQAAPAGIRIYERLGFRQFGGITEYKPVPQGGTAPAA